MINYGTREDHECDKLDNQLILFLGNILLELPVSKIKWKALIYNL